MNKVKNTFNLYWKQVMPCLTCSRQTAKHFRSEAYQSYLNYLADCPKEDAHPQELFGEPTDFAAFTMERLGEAEIQKTYTKRIGVKIALVVLAIAAIAIACLVIYFSRNPLEITYKEKTTIINYPDGVAPYVQEGAFVLNGDTGEYEKFDPAKHTWDSENGTWRTKNK